MKFRVALLSAIAVIVLAFTSAVGAEAAGYVTKQFTMTNGTYKANMTIVVWRGNSTTWHFREQPAGPAIYWDTFVGSGSGKFKMNALCIDWEYSPDHYGEATCIGGSSATLDDVAVNGSASWGAGQTTDHIFDIADEAAFRGRAYGVCGGSCSNRVDDYVLIGGVP